MRRLLAGVAVLLLCAGCGGGTVTTTVTTDAHPPMVPHATAQQLAADADAVSAALARGDGCGARDAAARLRADAVAAINAHAVPGLYQEVLLDRVNAVATAITCTPPPAPAPARHDHRHPGKEKHADGKGGKRD